MVKKRVMNPKPLFDPTLLYEAMDEAGVRREHAIRFWKSVIKQPDDYEQGIEEVVGVVHIPKKFKALLRDPDFALFTSKVVEENTSADGNTTKLLVELQDKQLVESVIMRHEGRTTLCVSSQVGCQMGCTFCATGTMGLLGNLWAGEILEQLLHANKRARITNIVFMGMGEPLNNYDNVIQAIRAMVDNRLFGLGRTKVTLSTVGVVPYMLRLTEDAPHVTMALSLHAPTQDLRSEIVPAAKAWKMPKLMDALDDHIAKTGRKVLCEYVMLDGINSSDEVAHDLGKLVKGRKVHINLIPYNPTDVPHDYKPPPHEQVIKFSEILKKEYGVFTTVRVEMGQDIDGACGQLAVRKEKKNAKAKEGSCANKEAGSAILNRGVPAKKGKNEVLTDIEDMGAAPSRPKPTIRARKQRSKAKKTPATPVVSAGDISPKEALPVSSSSRFALVMAVALAVMLGVWVTSLR